MVSMNPLNREDLGESSLDLRELAEIVDGLMIPYDVAGCRPYVDNLKSLAQHREELHKVWDIDEVHRLARFE